MVKELKDKGKTLYICEACGFVYEERAWAEKCQKWCQEHQSCNIEITAHAVGAETSLISEQPEEGGGNL